MTQAEINYAIAQYRRQILGKTGSAVEGCVEVLSPSLPVPMHRDPKWIPTLAFWFSWFMLLCALAKIVRM